MKQIIKNLLSIFIFWYSICQGLFIDQTQIVQGNKVFRLTHEWQHAPEPFPLKQEPEWFYKISGAYVAEIPNASIYGPYGIVILDSHKIYQDSLWTWSALFKAPSDLFPLPEPEQFDGTLATIALEGHSNYFHWMLEILPRIYLLQQSGYHYDKLYTPPLNYNFQKATLEAIGINLDTVIQATTTTHIKPTKLIFPSQVARSCVSTQWAIDFLRATFLGNYQLKDGKKKIFISRQNAKIRKIINEEEIFALLKPLGFEKIFMEKLSVQEQAQIAHEAEIIVGTHGAGLTNIIFARPGTTIIELFQEHLDECFFDLSSLLSFKHHCIKTERIKELSQEHTDIRYRNTFIKINTLKDQLLPLLQKITFAQQSQL